VLYYGYDNAGNMTSDGYKDLTVAYNVLNLPDVFTFANVTPNNKIEIVYNAAGEKLEKQVYTGARQSSRYLQHAHDTNKINSYGRRSYFFSYSFLRL
jgi:hypothetical protein